MPKAAHTIGFGHDWCPVAEWFKDPTIRMPRSALEKAYASVPGLGPEGKAVLVFMHVPKWGTYAALSTVATDSWACERVLE